MPKIPGIHHLKAVAALEKAGFRILRQGAHIVMTDGVRILTVPRHNPVNASGRYRARCRSQRQEIPQSLIAPGSARRSDVGHMPLPIGSKKMNALKWSAFALPQSCRP